MGFDPGLLAALAALATLALLRGERPADQRVQLPFDFRQTAGTSTDTLIGSLQDRRSGRTRKTSTRTSTWPMPISRKYGRRATRPCTPRRKTCSMRPRNWKPSLPSCSPRGGPSPSRATTSRRRCRTEREPWRSTRRTPATTASSATPRSSWGCTTRRSTPTRRWSTAGQTSILSPAWPTPASSTATRRAPSKRWSSRCKPEAAHPKTWPGHTCNSATSGSLQANWRRRRRPTGSRPEP